MKLRITGQIIFSKEIDVEKPINPASKEGFAEVRDVFRKLTVSDLVNEEGGLDVIRVTQIDKQPELKN